MNSGARSLCVSYHLIFTSKNSPRREAGSAAVSLFVLAVTAEAGVCSCNIQQGELLVHISQQKLSNRREQPPKTFRYHKREWTDCILLLHYISVGNIALFTPLYLPDN